MNGRVRPTRTGLAIAGLTLLVAAAAANTGANLLYLILALMLGTLGYAYLRGRRALAPLEVALALPKLVEEGRPFVATARVGGCGARSVRITPLARSSDNAGGGGAPTSFLPRGGFRVQRAVGRGGNNATATVEFKTSAPARGRFEESVVRASTRWPFHVVERARELTLAARIEVYPKLAPPRHPQLSWRGIGAAEIDRSGVGGSLRELRPYTPGDSPRAVHWPTTARTGTLTVRDDHQEALPELVLLLDTAAPPGAAFEGSLRIAASRVRDSLVVGFGVELRTPELVRSFRGAGDLESALRTFAAMTPAASVERGWDRVDDGRSALRVGPGLADVGSGAPR